RAVAADHAPRNEPPVTLNADQQRVYENIVADLDKGFGVKLLHGVTGSGKTEGYIRAIEHVVAADRTAIMLVPEIALTPQTVGRFLSRFQRVCVLHSGLTAAQRHAQWQLIRDNYPQVIVGARSAIFAPTHNLGLIVVDEEHDNSYKQDQAPRYHGRDVAIKRAQMTGVPVVLGSATPSLESYYNATQRQSYDLLELPNRVNDLPLPPVRIVDMLEERRQRVAQTGTQRVHLLSRPMESALRRTFNEGGQAILLLNRRGYANYVACPDHNCGWQMTCENCDVAMVYHLDDRVPAGGLTRCHYCGFENRLPTACPSCGKKVLTFGLGTQRVEEEIERKFPDVRLIRMDSDAMRTAGHYEDALRRFGEGDIDLLVGTQMIAKGLDFPNVRMVGVISADTALNLPDFRATERTFQLVSQVSGRSGRGLASGSVVVQTFTPGHRAIERAAAHDYPGFARAEMEMRTHANLPPVSRMARIVCRDRDLDRALDAAQACADALLKINEELATGTLVLGPLAPPIARIGGYYRMQIEITAQDAHTLQHILTTARNHHHIRSDARMAVDVDPVSLL
ncbi:MAG: primosomal protein N', partial [Desulfobacterales bacterium]|nr:primosomal protein N' [Desulfobacterales bacterium]